jgi:protein-disulfide isomerase-like protein with CxxC motif
VEGRDIGRREIVLGVAHQTGLDMESFTRQFQSAKAKNAVLEEGRLGKEKYGVTETPTVMLTEGSKLQHALAMPSIENGRIVAVGKLRCCGEGCYDAERSLFKQALGARGE